ncbi:hypothetical protein CONPUDRAFT_160990 [Coniophora puteana RWD-64-598 SS2]|uniref:F-box domain-containing protein n=1 Tax=Coniophora puteana (strain RWD-64-598) TaxID=741705 RepID=A0A5M3N4I9_CONPW|nr:uncharacterized protein CONPUDRAFT_160990 [Coniophora puteana RWD-64-598 SS2]EIW86167.1 hypothetical protein CONPUDRAFT_160990 [Coniophora puteana RWD-64-598 SS2]
MHPALGLSEVLERIFSRIGDELDDDYSPSPSSRPLPIRNSTLARLARTCKTFKKPAIDGLWSEIPATRIYESLIPHLVVMWKEGDPDPYDWREITVKGTWIADVRPMSTADQLNLMEYTTSIRRFTLGSPDIAETAIAAPAILALLSLPGGLDVVFPRLSRVHIYHQLPGLLQEYLPLIFSVECIRLVAISRIDDLFMALVDAFTTRKGPHVQEIDLQFKSSDWHSDQANRGSFPTMLSQAVMRCENLRTFACTVLDQATLLRLSGLSSLTFLELHGLDDIDTTPTLQFLSLGSLKLTFNVFSDAVYFILRLVRIPPSIHIRIADEPSAPLSAQLFDEISRVPEANVHALTLERFVPPIHPEHTHDPPISIETIEPLLKFAGMRVFRWIFLGRVHLTDANVGLVTQSWPLLEQLWINSESYDHVPFATLSSIFIAAQHCPHLEYLSLPVDASRITDDGSLAAEIRHESLRVIELGTSFVDAMGLATIVHTFARAFPRLKWVRLNLPVGGEDTDSQTSNGQRAFGWRICEAIKMLRQAKENGRIASWTDEDALKILIRYFEVAWDTDKSHGFE